MRTNAIFKKTFTGNQILKSYIIILSETQGSFKIGSTTIILVL